MTATPPTAAEPVPMHSMPAPTVGTQEQQQQEQQQEQQQDEQQQDEQQQDEQQQHNTVPDTPTPVARQQQQLQKQQQQQQLTGPDTVAVQRPASSAPHAEQVVQQEAVPTATGQQQQVLQQQELMGQQQAVVLHPTSSTLALAVPEVPHAVRYWEQPLWLQMKLIVSQRIPGLNIGASPQDCCVWFCIPPFHHGCRASTESIQPQGNVGGGGGVYHVPCTQEDLMWMACFWDPLHNDYCADQYWGRRWPLDIKRAAVFCKEGLRNMIAYKVKQRSSSSGNMTASCVTECVEDLKLAIMLTWCTRVTEDIMPHGPLLAHAVQCGHSLEEHSMRDAITGEMSTFLVPKKHHGTWEDYSWEKHGGDGVDGIKAILLVSGFWTAPIMPVSHLPALAPARSQQDENLTLLAEGAARSVLAKLAPPRGVKVFLKEACYQENYSWVERDGVPHDVTQCFLRPASFVCSVPGAVQVTYFMQSMGHYFYALYRHERTGNLVAKCVKGRTPVGRRQWRPDDIADVEVGLGHIDNFRFVRGIYLEDSGRDVPICLYMERRRERRKQPEQLYLLACCEVPAAIQSCVQPSSFQPCTKTAGYVQDPGRQQRMYQGAGNGPILFTVGPMLFSQDRV